MSILFCTPAYGGQVTAGYFNSCLNLQESLLAGGVDFDFLITSNESLITRARNTSVATFLKTDFEYLMFIDADIEFEGEDVRKLTELDAEVACAAYPMKRPDKPVSAWRGGKLVDLDLLAGPTEVDFAGTGFLLIHRSVLMQMAAKHPELQHTEGHVGKCYALFNTYIKNDTFLSEDYAFCQRWRDMGGKIILDPSIRLKHWGNYCYQGVKNGR